MLLIFSQIPKLILIFYISKHICDALKEQRILVVHYNIHINLAPDDFHCPN